MTGTICHRFIESLFSTGKLRFIYSTTRPVTITLTGRDDTNEKIIYSIFKGLNLQLDLDVHHGIRQRCAARISFYGVTAFDSMTDVHQDSLYSAQLQPRLSASRASRAAIAGCWVAPLAMDTVHV